MMEEKDPNEEMIILFAKWRIAEDAVRNLEVEKKQKNEDIDKRIQTQQLVEIEARLAVEALMNKNGITEDILPGGNLCDYKVSFQIMPITVKIADEKAVSKEFIEEKMEKVIKKKELLKWLKEQREAGINLPNWVSLERAPRKLQWKLIKK